MIIIQSYNSYQYYYVVNFRTDKRIIISNFNKKGY